MLRGNMGGYPSPNGPSSMSKRPRMDDNFPMKHEIKYEDDYGPPRLSGPADYGFTGGSVGGVGSQQQQQAVRVLSVRSLHENVMEADLVDALSHFGAVSYVSLTGRGTALVEFEEIASAERVVNYNMTTDLMVLNQPAMFSFSNLQTIPRSGFESERPSHVLVMYVQNPKYPITTDVINAICKPVSRITRIKIIREANGIQCLVELGDVEAARAVKQRLNGCDIYSGCCTLKIEYSKLTRLNVTKNDNDEADYVTPPAALNAANFNAASKDRPALLQEPPVFTGPMDNGPPRQNRGGGGFQNEMGGGGMYDDFARPLTFEDQRYPGGSVMDRYSVMGGPMGDPQMQQGRGGYDEDFEYRGSRFGGHPAVNSVAFGRGGGGWQSGMDSSGLDGGGYGPPDSYGGGGGRRHPDGYGVGEENSVLIIYGLSAEKVNCDKLFNLFCQYGNVVRIKFLKSKQDTVMVQMGDPIAAQRAIENLNYCTVMGGKMSVTLSRQATLHEVRDPTEMPDKTLSYKDYSSNRNNRFLSPEIATKNRINAPQKYLYFFNAPPHITEQELLDVMKDNHAPKPIGVKIFSKKENYAKNSAGIYEFETEDESVEAIMLCNHLPLDAEGSKTPFVLKLCFAGPPSSSVTNDSSGGRNSSRSGTYNGPAGPPRGSNRDDDRDRGDRRSSGSRGGGGYRGRGEGYRGRGRGRGR